MPHQSHIKKLGRPSGGRRAEVAGINKVGEVLERTAAELLKIRNFGDKSLDELRARLEENDLPVPGFLKQARSTARWMAPLLQESRQRSITSLWRSWSSPPGR